jgi:chromosome segregation ATPase
MDQPEPRRPIKELEELRKAKTELTTRVASIESANKALDAERQRLKASVESLQGENSGLAAQLRTLQQANKNLQAAFASVQTEGVKVKAERDALLLKGRQLETENKGLASAFEELRKRAPPSDQAVVLDRQLKVAVEEREALKDRVLKLFNENQGLQATIDDLRKTGATLRMEDVGGTLRSALDSIYKEVGSPTTLRPGYAVDKFEIELKSGLDARDGLKFVQPLAAELKPESLSTVRISLKSKPTIKITEE